MRQIEPAPAGDTFAREWTFAFALVIAIGAVLLVIGHHLLGATAIGLSAAALVLRHKAMRKQNLSFYGRERLRD